jgi:SAM-dependent methyltransferase
MLVTLVTGQLLSLLPKTDGQRMEIYQIFFILVFVLSFFELGIIKKFKPIAHSTNSNKPFKIVIKEIFQNKSYLLFITCSLILHEVPQKVRLDILKEAKRVLRNEGRILLIDYHPGPINKAKGLYSKLIINLIEFLAGREHYTNYCHFIKNGGLPSLIDLLELKVENQKILSGGNFGIFILSK